MWPDRHHESRSSTSYWGKNFDEQERENTLSPLPYGTSCSVYTINPSSSSSSASSSSTPFLLEPGTLEGQV